MKVMLIQGKGIMNMKDIQNMTLQVFEVTDEIGIKLHHGQVRKLQLHASVVKIPHQDRHGMMTTLLRQRNPVGIFQRLHMACINNLTTVDDPCMSTNQAHGVEIVVYIAVVASIPTDLHHQRHLHINIMIGWLTRSLLTTHQDLQTTQINLRICHQQSLMTNGPKNRNV